LALMSETVSAVPPPGVQGHLQDVQVLASAQQAEVRREVGYLAQAVAPLGVPLTLMKGAAYLMSGSPAANGRLYTDVDIIVPKHRLPEVEATLMLNGWATTHHSPYDQRYYRQWMHELPPMQHLYRQTVVDVHHAILPETARLRPDSSLLLAAAVPLAGDRRIQVLARPDMVLHSMTHLLHNEELSHGLRDLSDIDLMLREFGAEAAFWDALLARAGALSLRRPLFYGLRYAAAILGTPVPARTTVALQGAGPGPLLLTVMDGLFLRALTAQHPTAAVPGTAAALFGLYLRAHWLRMPPFLLARHLTTKALMRRRPEATEDGAPARPAA
jgi:hypothetical protein